jgi:hypothetical protein
MGVLGGKNSREKKFALGGREAIFAVIFSIFAVGKDRRRLWVRLYRLRCKIGERGKRLVLM